MPSSTSSSNLGRLAWGACACIAMLACWQGLIWCGLIPPSTGIHQWEDNVIRVQRYVDAPRESRPVVLVGSSLMARLEAARVGGRVLNVALSGGSPRTGIEMVRRHPVAEVLVVEMSGLAARGSDKELINEELGGFSAMRRWFSVFRREYQPLSVAVSLWKAHVLEQRAKRSKPSKQSTKTAESRAKGLRGTLATYQQPLTEAQAKAIREGAEEMRRQLLELKRSTTVKILLDHVPLDPAVEATPNARQTQEILRGVFSGSDWQWVPEPPGHAWETNDGLHLTEAAALAYAQFLREWLVSQKLQVD